MNPRSTTNPLLRVTLAAAALSLFSGGVSGCIEPEPDKESLIAAFEKIHSNIYEVYGCSDPGKIFVLLSRSCEGEELEKQVYEYLKCLKVQDEFNTKISIADVIYNDLRVESIDGDTVTVYCKWIVIGKVRHPTHIHRKTNLNEALYRVRISEKGPRITGYDLITNQELEVTNR